MSIPTRQTDCCKNCRYWEASVGDRELSLLGYCLRYAPSPSSPTDDDNIAYWPRTRDYHRCGEFEWWT